VSRVAQQKLSRGDQVGTRLALDLSRVILRFRVIAANTGLRYSIFESKVLLAFVRAGEGSARLLEDHQKVVPRREFTLPVHLDS
jgi:hypothetical protein